MEKAEKLLVIEAARNESRKSKERFKAICNNCCDFLDATYRLTTSISELHRSEYDFIFLFVEEANNLKRLLAEIENKTVRDTVRRDGARVSTQSFVIFTSESNSKNLELLLEAGIWCIISINEDDVEIHKTLQQIDSNQTGLSPLILKSTLSLFSGDQQKHDFQKEGIYRGEGVESKLTKREAEVLVLIAKGYSRKEIARLLKITQNTTAGYVKSIYSKLRVNSKVEATTEAYELGLLQLAS